MSGDPKEVAVSQLIERAWHEGDLTVLDELIASEFIGRTVGFPESHGPKGFKDFVQEVRGAFPDCRHPIEEMVVGDSVVVIRWRFTGTHKGEFLGISPTDRKVEIIGLELFRFEDNRIVESWSIPDVLGLIKQLGVESLDDIQLGLCPY